MFQKLLSRRFLLTVGVCIAEAAGFNVPIEIIGAVGAYVLGESATDTASAFKRSKPNGIHTPSKVK